MVPILLFVTVITTIQAYNVFTQVFVLASDVQGAPGYLVPVLVYDIFQNGFRYFNFGYAAAEAVYLFLVVIVADAPPVPAVQPADGLGRGRDDQPRREARITSSLIQVVLVAVGLVMVFPLFWLVSTSLRPAPELLESPPIAPAPALDARQLRQCVRRRRRSGRG